MCNKKDWVSISVVCLVAVCLLLGVSGCESGVNSRLTYQYRASNIVVRATVEIPSTITASNLVVTWIPMTGEVTYKADWVTRSNEGVVKLTADRDVKLLDASGKVIGYLSEGVMKGILEGAKIP